MDTQNKDTITVNKITPPATENPMGQDNSAIFGVSLRGWIALLVVATVCGMSIANIIVVEPLYTLAGLVVGFYYGHQQGLTQKKS